MMEEKKSLKQIVLDKRKVGKVVVMGIEGPMSMPLEDIVRQPVDGLLYDLNRLEEVTLTFIDDPKWINDFAVALVIRKLKSDIDKLEAENERSREALTEQLNIRGYAFRGRCDGVPEDIERAFNALGICTEEHKASLEGKM